jgi:hypothetical protein
VLAPTSPADVLDRLTILDLKVARIPDAARRTHARRHRDALLAAWRAEGLPAPEQLPEHAELARINGELWAVEDALRSHEREGRFDDAFVALARSVYHLNDARAAAKSRLDARLGAAHTDVKSYGPSDAADPPG